MPTLQDSPGSVVIAVPGRAVMLLGAHANRLLPLALPAVQGQPQQLSAAAGQHLLLIRSRQEQVGGSCMQGEWRHQRSSAAGDSACASAPTTQPSGPCSGTAGFPTIAPTRGTTCARCRLTTSPVQARHHQPSRQRHLPLYVSSAAGHPSWLQCAQHTLSGQDCKM
jgi:hypothetical protein